MQKFDQNESCPTRTLKALVTMHQETSYHPEFDKMLNSVSPFLDYFQISHFYYLRILPSGEYATLGTCRDLHEHFLEKPDFFKSDPCIRHPNNLKSGVFIENTCNEPDFIETINEVLEKFKMKFTVRIQRKTDQSCEIFGFATKLIKSNIEDALLNDLFLVNKFLDHFYKENEKIIRIAHDNQVNLLPLIGSYFYKSDTLSLNLPERKKLLQQLGIETGEFLSKREKEILQYITNGYPASYIASHLHISVRTVEHHIDELKSKLNCNSKIELINLSKNMIIQ